MKKVFPYLFLTLITFVFFWQFFIKGLVPISADTIIGLYHPFRDLYAKNYPNGIPFKNFLITDPVRQQYPWRELIVSIEKKLELPLWNPYNFSGAPLLANFQSASFYPLNILFFIMPFATGWSLIIFLGPLLSGIFLFLYLNNLKLNKLASLLGAFTFSFSGFFISWLEWGTIMHTVLWLPLILLSIDKIFTCFQKSSNVKTQISKTWSLIFIISLISSFFAGHLQTFFYLFIFSSIYLLVRWLQYGRDRGTILLFVIYYLLFTIATAIQWIPTLQLIFLSARNADVMDFNNPGWFIPWQHLIQFVAPDFFGNPATLNYWGVWNYGELVAYIGIIPLILALFAMFCRKDKKTLFFGSIFFLAVIFALPTFLAKIPYLLKIPFFATAQPTRLIFIIDFCLSVLSALGFDYLLKAKKKIAIAYPLAFVLIVMGSLWIFIPKEHMSVVKSNLLLPTALTISSLILLLMLAVWKKNKYAAAIAIIIIAITIFDLFRFGWKFTPFVKKEYLFPNTKTIDFLQKNIGIYRLMSTDSRILPPNFSTIYRVQSIDGYDPLYLLRYAELVAALERGKPDISTPFGFNRIITPHNFESKIIDLLGVKFVLSLTELKSDKFKKVFQEGETRIYENINVVPRAFFVSEVISVDDSKEAINTMFEESFTPGDTAVVEDFNAKLQNSNQINSPKIAYYSENKIVIETDNAETGFLVLTDSFYPTWEAVIDSVKTKIYKTDYNFRGIVVLAGKHRVEFRNFLF